jgi:hypothetical protein
MVDGTRTKRPRREPVGPATAAKARQIEEDVRAWYRRGQQALGVSSEGAQDVGQAMQTLSAEVGTTPGPHDSGKAVLVGHTSQKGGRILDLGHLKCIDTYCHGGGWLTALDVQTGEVWQADRQGNMRTV